MSGTKPQWGSFLCTFALGGVEALLVEIAEGVARISDRNIQIASAAEEQSAVSEDINRNVNDQ
ncbi:methyl-accepting chemotaxis protein [Pseudomonas sp. St290]|nr:methyl-accepting chemotaxis protein [Pseudomonas sp. St290]